MIPMTNLKQIGDGTSKVFSCSKAYIECFRSRHESICIVIFPRALYDVYNISDVGALLVIAQHLRLGEGDKGFSGNSACRVHVL
jgi:hypothetical protein